MKNAYRGPERRRFVRLDYVTPLGFKVCNKKTISKLLQGYAANISPAGLLCNINQKVKRNDILWLSFDRGVLSVCESLEKRSLIYQNGVIGKVVRIVSKKNNTYDIGIQFITREEKNLTNIYPKVYFLKGQVKPEEQEEDLEEGQQEEGPEEVRFEESGQ